MKSIEGSDKLMPTVNLVRELGTICAVACVHGSCPYEPPCTGSCPGESEPARGHLDGQTNLESLQLLGAPDLIDTRA